MIFVSISSVPHQAGPIVYEVPMLLIQSGTLARRFITITKKNSSLSQRIRSGYKHELLAGTEKAVIQFARVDLEQEGKRFVLTDCVCYEAEDGKERWIVFESTKVQELKEQKQKGK